jgi:serine/threonine protein kinase
LAVLSAIVGVVKPGDVIDGKYRIEALLGEGGMGVVYAASHMTIGNTVAIKVLRSEAMRSPEVPARFKREATNMGMLRSEHVIRVIDIGALPTGEPFMVMEMLHGTDLGSRLKQGPVPPHQAVDFIVQACEGLAEAHKLGMVHRDIKPANLFVTSRPNGTALVKVLDFGIATAASGSIDPRLTSTQSVMGSPSYMSPEQLKGARDVDARSDIWSLGVTLYELITGNQPFSGNTLTALSLAIVTDAHERPVNMPASIIPIIDKCLDKERNHRFQNVAELAQALAPLFPGGSYAADMVRSSYSQPVPPTLHGLEASQLLGSQPTMAPGMGMGPGTAGHSAFGRPSSLAPASATSGNVGMTSTTSLASGETGTSIPSRSSKKWVWLTAGLATIALGVGVGIVVGRGNNSEAVARPASDQPAPPPAANPPPPEPKTVDKGESQPPPPPEPIKEEIKDPPKVEDPPKDPVVVVDPKKQPKRPGRPPKRPGDKRLPVEPPDYTKTDPPKVDPPKVDPPKVDPRKQPCAPNDPRCGL